MKKLWNFIEKVDKNTPLENVRSDKFERGDRVNWLNPINKEMEAGTLWLRHKVVWEMSVNPYDSGKAVNRWEWEIYGDDGHFYVFREEYLIKE